QECLRKNLHLGARRCRATRAPFFSFIFGVIWQARGTNVRRQRPRPCGL
ncbi:unnamed protein product, partial [Ectocarpus fasciculatus]